jgi:Galactose oxidase-like, Early set domain/Galactose oxidase, central domain/Kelch motif
MKDAKRPAEKKMSDSMVKEQERKIKQINSTHHKRLLKFINDAGSPFSLMNVPVRPMAADQMADMDHGSAGLEMKMELMDGKSARSIYELREREFPLGFTNINQLLKIPNLNILKLIEWLSDFMYGSWQTLPYVIPRQGGGSVSIVHAALLHTGKVLFLDDGPTPIWDPTDEVNPQFEFPPANPDYSLTCSGHSFLSDGKLLVLGGGGFGPRAGANKGFKFDPVAKTWSKTTGDMSKVRWYPTAVTTGDARVLVVGGWNENANLQNDIEVYDEASDSFVTISGATLGFPNLYPGLHLLPNNVLFYTRTGWGHAGGAAPASLDSSSYFQFSGSTVGSWSPIAASTINRCKGMSVMIYRNTCPHTRILVVGGCDSSGSGINSPAEIIDVSFLSPASAWVLTAPLPDTNLRRQCNAVLLPDNTVFVAGGVSAPNSPSMLFDPVANTWSPMADLPSARMYHSVMILLPSGKVMMSGWANDAPSGTIELYSPPYFFKGARPQISSAPATINFGQQFTIGTPDATNITKVTMVKPMAVTHQTETNQRVIELVFLHDHVHPNNLIATAPNGGSPHAFVPRGFYMLFVLNNAGVPSVAKWIHLQ